MKYVFKYLPGLLLAWFITSNALAQHEQHQMPMPTAKPVEKPVEKSPAKTVQKRTAAKKEATKVVRKPVPKPILSDTMPMREMDHGAMKMDSGMVGDSSSHSIEQKQSTEMSGMQGVKMDSGSHPGHTMNMDMPMSHAFSLSLPMNRNGSGTGWLPDRTPMYGYMAHAGKWMLMFHGNAVVRYNNQDVGRKGTRGDTKVDVPNWFMAMGQRQVGRNGLFRFSTMFSLDPVFGLNGYPLLFQTGETYNGKALVDRQHPHNLFSELSVAYTHRLSDDVDVTGYFGLPGEPALGPVAFMHRISSMNLPDAPLGHHWQDATHITFGVATLGVRYKSFKIEGSTFKGREPGEARYGIDRPRFDSYSGRLSWAAAPSLVLQVSQAYIKSPEAVEPEENVNRTTASASHSLVLPGREKVISTTAIWGYNNAGRGHREHSALLESNLQLNRLALYGRSEWIEKSAGELLLEDDFGDGTLFRVSSLTLGTNYRLFEVLKTRVSAGVQGTLYMAPAALNTVYGENPVALQVYLRFWPGLMMGPASKSKSY